MMEANLGGTRSAQRRCGCEDPQRREPCHRVGKPAGHPSVPRDFVVVEVEGLKPAEKPQPAAEFVCPKVADHVVPAMNWHES